LQFERETTFFGELILLYFIRFLILF